RKPHRSEPPRVSGRVLPRPAMFNNRLDVRSFAQMKTLTTLFAIFLFTFTISAQRELGVRPTETGGPLKFEQAVYDVQSYDVSIKVDPAAKSISGTTVMTART